MMCRTARLAAVIAAGCDPNEADPLHEYTQGGPKALIPIAGKPMIAYVADSLAGSQYVQDVFVVGLPSTRGPDYIPPSNYVPGAGSIVDNYRAGMRYAQEKCPDLDAVLLCGSDIPTITSQIVDSFITQCLQTNHDLYYSIVERSVMETRFPGSGRSYIVLRDGAFAGGDMLLARPGLVLNNNDLWQQLASARKNAFKQASLLGLWTLFRLITRRLSLEEIEHRVCQVLRINGKAVPFDYAEIGMDVDKPDQLAIVRSDIEERTSFNTKA